MELDLESMGQIQMTFGKTHVGRAYAEMWDQEKSWINWFTKMYAESTKIEHRKMLTYVEKRVEVIETQQPEIMSATTSAQNVIWPKSKAPAKSLVHRERPVELAPPRLSQNSWDMEEPAPVTS